MNDDGFMDPPDSMVNLTKCGSLCRPVICCFTYFVCGYQRATLMMSPGRLVIDPGSLLMFLIKFSGTVCIIVLSSKEVTLITYSYFDAFIRVMASQGIYF